MNKKLLSLLVLGSVTICVGCKTAVPTPSTNGEPEIMSADNKDNKIKIDSKDKGISSQSDDKNCETALQSTVSVEFTGQTYENAKFSVGSDLSAGEYIAYNDTNGVVNIYNNSNLVISYTVNSGESLYFNLEEGQTLELQNMKVALSSDTKIEATNGVFTDGMYKVGKDLPEGGYIIKPVTSTGLYEYASACNGDVNSMIATSKVNSDIHIELKEGNFITLRDISLSKE